MEITLNGESIETQSQDVQALVEEYIQDDDTGGVAVSVNETVIPKSRWNEQPVKEEDRVEIIRATQGG